MRLIISLFLLVPSFLLGQEVIDRETYMGPIVLPLILNPAKNDLVPGEDYYLSIEYLASPKGKVLATEPSEKIWWFDDIPVLFLGATGDYFPMNVASRATAWVRVNQDKKELGIFEVAPRKDRVRIQPETGKIAASLQKSLTGVNASYLAQVANYLVNNLATLDVVGSSYSIDGVGTVVDAEGQWVGDPTGLQGPAGVEGPQGLPGEPGSDGKSVLNGVGIPDDGQTGVNGEFYIDTASYEIYGPKAGVWGEPTSLVGPQGAPGGSGSAATSSWVSAYAVNISSLGAYTFISVKNVSLSDLTVLVEFMQADGTVVADTSTFPGTTISAGATYIINTASGPTNPLSTGDFEGSVIISSNTGSSQDIIPYGVFVSLMQLGSTFSVTTTELKFYQK